MSSDCAKLTKQQVIEKYSSEYLRILLKNRWIQNYRQQRYLWQDEYEDIWLPDLRHLWILAELHSTESVSMNKILNSYIAKVKLREMRGSCPEEAMLKLFIF